MRLLCACQWRIQEFPLGDAELLGRRQPLTWALFNKNVCKKERIGSRWGRGATCWWCPPGSANACHWWIQGAPPACAPQQNPILSFLHMFSPKSTHIRGRHPPMARRPPPPPTGNPGSATAC